MDPCAARSARTLFDNLELGSGLSPGSRIARRVLRRAAHTCVQHAL